MKTKRIAISLMTVSGLILAGMGGASVAWGQLVSSAGMERVSGKILSVDPAQKLLKLEAKKQLGSVPTTEMIDFVLSEETVISEGGRPLKPADLRTGTMVAVEYADEGNQRIAQSITVQEPTEAGPSATPEEGDPPSQEPEGLTLPPGSSQ